MSNITKKISEHTETNKNGNNAINKKRWIIDSFHSEIGFRAKYLLFTNVKGSFKQFEAAIETEGDDFAMAQIELRINAASIDTGNEQRDTHLKNADFFDVENFEEIIFRGTSIDKMNDTEYELNGNLTIKGVKKQVTLDVEFGGMIKDPWGNQKAVFAITGKIKRSDWGLNWNAALETGGVLVSDEIRIECEIQLAKKGDS